MEIGRLVAPPQSLDPMREAKASYASLISLSARGAVKCSLSSHWGVLAVVTK